MYASSFITGPLFVVRRKTADERGNRSVKRACFATGKLPCTRKSHRTRTCRRPSYAPLVCAPDSGFIDTDRERSRRISFAETAGGDVSTSARHQPFSPSARDRPRTQSARRTVIYPRARAAEFPLGRGGGGWPAETTFILLLSFTPRPRFRRGFYLYVQDRDGDGDVRPRVKRIRRRRGLRAFTCQRRAAVPRQHRATTTTFRSRTRPRRLRRAHRPIVESDRNVPSRPIVFTNGPRIA